MIEVFEEIQSQILRLHKAEAIDEGLVEIEPEEEWEKEDYLNDIPNTIKIKHFSFESVAIDGEVYNHLFFMTVEKEIVIGMFNCDTDSKEDWQEIVPQMIQSIKIKV